MRRDDSVTRAASARSSSLAIAWIALALAIAVVLAHARVVVRSETWDDVRYHTEIAPPRLAAGAQLRSGELPAWWDGTGLGVPLLAEPSHGALSPTTWLARTAGELDALLVLHLWWAALGVAMWARRRGASDLASLAAGLLIASTGILTSAAVRGALPAIAQLPWLGFAACALATARDRSARACCSLAIGALTAVIALTGQLAVVVDAIVVVATVAGWRCWRGAAIGVVAGGAIGALQWAPAALQVGRDVGVPVSALPLARLVELVVPGRFGGAAAWFPSLYAGAGLFALVRAHRRDVVAIAVLAALALVAARGGVASWTGAPELHLAALVCMVAARAAAGLDDAFAGRARTAVALAVAAIVTCAATAAVAATHPDADLASLWRDGGLASASLALAALAVVRARGSWLAPIVVAFVATPSVSALSEVAPTIDRAEAGVSAPAAWTTAAIAASPDLPRPPVRVYRPEPFELIGGQRVRTLAEAFATLAGESAAGSGVALAHGGDAARGRGDEDVWLAAAAEGGALLDRFGIGIAILPSTVAGAHGFRALATGGAYSLVELPVAPVASVMRGWRWSSEPANTLALLFPPGGGLALPRGTVVLDGRGEPRNGPRPPTACAIEAWRDGDIALTCTTDVRAYAVVDSSAAPGWSATIDGADAPWLGADVLRRAVALPPGAHSVRWRYSPPGLAVGAAIAGAGALVLALLAVIAVRGPRRPEVSSPS